MDFCGQVDPNTTRSHRQTPPIATARSFQHAEKNVLPPGARSTAPLARGRGRRQQRRRGARGASRRRPLRRPRRPMACVAFCAAGAALALCARRPMSFLSEVSPTHHQEREIKTKGRAFRGGRLARACNHQQQGIGTSMIKMPTSMHAPRRTRRHDAPARPWPSQRRAGWARGRGRADGARTRGSSETVAVAV